MKINPKRLSRYIMSRDSKNTTNRLLSFYESLTKKQRSEIKEMFIKNSKKPYAI